MAAKVILNPYAGRWKAKERKADVVSALQKAKIEFDLVETSAPGHGSVLAANAVEDGYTSIIAAGGDGSISEVVNGIMSFVGKENTDQVPPLGIVPLGSANDLTNNLGLPTDIYGSIEIIANANSRKIDLGVVNARYFDNNSAIGLEPTITLIQQRITRVRGVVRYLLATLIGVMQNSCWNAKLEWDGGEYFGPITLVTIGNNPVTGGIFYVTPHADPYDGLLTFVYGYMATRFQVLKLLPRTMKPGEGNYVDHEDIHEIHTRRLNISTESPTPMHADGEIQSEAITELEYSIQPECLPIFLD